MQRKIRLMIGILIMTGLIAGCWKVSKNLQKELKEEMIMIEEIEERMPKIKENVQEILNNKQREKVRQEKKIEERRNSRI